MTAGWGYRTVHCSWCGDEFNPDGMPGIDGPNFCSDDCADKFDDDRFAAMCADAYNEARYGSAPVF